MVRPPGLVELHRAVDVAVDVVGVVQRVLASRIQVLIRHTWLDLHGISMGSPWISMVTVDLERKFQISKLMQRWVGKID